MGYLRLTPLSPITNHPKATELSQERDKLIQEFNDCRQSWHVHSRMPKLTPFRSSRLEELDQKLRILLADADRLATIISSMTSARESLKMTDQIKEIVRADSDKHFHVLTIWEPGPRYVHIVRSKATLVSLTIFVIATEMRDTGS
jgi:hypothetical protein